VVSSAGSKHAQRFTPIPSVTENRLENTLTWSLFNVLYASSSFAWFSASGILNSVLRRMTAMVVEILDLTVSFLLLFWRGPSCLSSLAMGAETKLDGQEREGR